MLTIIASLLVSGNISGENCGFACKSWKGIPAMEAPKYRKKIPFRDCFTRYSQRYGVPESLLISVAAGESDFNSLAVSTSDAIGLMQIKWPITAQHLGVNRRDLLFQPCDNIKLGAKYLKELILRYKNSIHHALAAYYYGPSRVSLAKEVPAAANDYSNYIFKRYSQLVVNRTSSIKLAHINNSNDINLKEGPDDVSSKKDPDGVNSKERWISNLHSEKANLERAKSNLLASSKKIKGYFKMRASMKEKS